MSSQIHTGIPTTYRGVRFRSRLEARWARFFDALGWGWQYEPFDLAGYIPDFVLRFDQDPLLVEVKPALSLVTLLQQRTKLEASGWEHEAILVGADLFEPEHVHPILGLIGERVAGPEGAEWCWGGCRLFRCVSCGQASLLSESGSWMCRVCGTQEGHLGTFTRAREAWVEAANRVQWKAP